MRLSAKYDGLYGNYRHFSRGLLHLQTLIPLSYTERARAIYELEKWSEQCGDIVSLRPNEITDSPIICGQSYAALAMRRLNRSTWSRIIFCVCLFNFFARIKWLPWTGSKLMCSKEYFWKITKNPVLGRAVQNGKWETLCNLLWPRIFCVSRAARRCIVLVLSLLIEPRFH